MLKTAVLTVSFPNDAPTARMYEISQETIKQYAAKYGADYICITEKKYSLPRPEVPHLEKLWVQEYLDKYDRVLYMDSDILVTPHARDIFKLYPDEVTYGYDEGHLPWVQEDVAYFENRYGLTFSTAVNGFKQMLNGGVIIYCKASKPIFENFDLSKFTRSFGNTLGEQSYFNTLMQRHKVPFKILDYSFNYSVYMSEQIFADRLSADFVHYCGGPHFLNKTKPRADELEDDYKTLYLGAQNGVNY